jgi:hypothetical protein
MNTRTVPGLTGRWNRCPNTSRVDRDSAGPLPRCDRALELNGRSDYESARQFIVSSECRQRRMLLTVR